MGLLDFLISKRKKRIALFNHHILEMKEGMSTICSVRTSNSRYLKQLAQMTELYLVEVRDFRKKEERNLTRTQLHEFDMAYLRLELQYSKLITSK
ncbi:MAG: hypothetical protein AABX23_03495 [Nanoarchaeota archaeon]